MDIRKHAVAETTVLHLRDAADELMYDEKKNPVTITLYGPGSKQYARAQARQQNRMMDKLKRKGKSDQTAEEKTAETAEFLVDCTASMDNIDYDKLAGEALYKAVYSDPTIGFVAEQAAKHIGDWSNFKMPLPTK